jgi:hypothetical protein
MATANQAVTDDSNNSKHSQYIQDKASTLKTADKLLVTAMESPNSCTQNLAATKYRGVS